jgi:hypothetical protein
MREQQQLRLLREVALLETPPVAAPTGDVTGIEDAEAPRRANVIAFTSDYKASPRPDELSRATRVDRFGGSLR